MDKLYAIQDVFISVQSALDEAASYGERIKKCVSPSERVLKASLMHVSKYRSVNLSSVPSQHC